MQSRQEENLSEQFTSTSERRISETSEIRTIEDFIEPDGSIDLWKIYAEYDYALEVEALQKVTQVHLYYTVISKKGRQETLLHFLAREHRIKSIENILRTLEADDDYLTTALNTKDDDGNIVTYKLLACAHADDVNNMLKIILDLYPAKNRFASLAVIENQNNETVLEMLARRSINKLEQLDKIYDVFSEIYLVSYTNDRIANNFLYSLQDLNVTDKLALTVIEGDLEMASLSLALKYFDNFNSVNIELLTEWYFLKSKYRTYTNQIDSKKIVLMLNSFGPQSLTKDIYEADLTKQYPEIVSAIKMNLLKQLGKEELAQVFNCYGLAVRRLNQFLYKCSQSDNLKIKNAERIETCRKNFGKMTLLISDSLEKSLSNTYKDDFYKNKADIYLTISFYAMNVLAYSFEKITETIDDQLKSTQLFNTEPVTDKTDLVNPSIEDQLDKFSHIESELEILTMKIHRNDIDLLRQNALNSLYKSKNNSIDLRKIFNRLDLLVVNILKVILTYDPRNNDHRKQSIQDLLTAVESAYKACVITDLTLEGIKQIVENLKQTCASIATAVENDHMHAGKFSSLGTKSRFAKDINFAIKTHNKADLLEFKDLTPEQVKLFEKIYLLFISYAKKTNPPEELKYNTKILFPTTQDKLEIIQSKYTFDLAGAKAIDLALEFSEDGNSRNKDLIFQLYKFMDPKLINFTVSPSIIDIIIKCLDDKLYIINVKEKSDLTNQYIDLICHIKMTALQQSNLISNNQIFIARNEVLAILAEHCCTEMEINKFNVLDLLICKMLKVYANYNPGQNQNRILNKELLYQELSNAYQTIIDCKQINMDTFVKLYIKLKNKCMEIDLDVARHHRKTGLLGKVGKESSFAKALNEGLQETSDNSSHSKTVSHFNLINKFKLFGKHEAIPLPEHVIDDNNNVSSDKRDDVTQFNNLIKELFIVLPSKWKTHLSTLIDEASKVTEQQIDETDTIEPTRMQALKHLACFIVKSRLDLLNGETDFQANIKQLQQHLLQIKVSSQQESHFKSRTATKLTNFIQNHLEPMIVNKTTFRDESNHSRLNKHTYTH